MDILMNLLLEEIALYGITFIVCVGIVAFYLLRERKKSKVIAEKVKVAKEEDKFEPVSLHPYIDLNTCIGSVFPDDFLLSLCLL
jgi:thioredoxin reductase (NADPH)